MEGLQKLVNSQNTKNKYFDPQKQKISPTGGSNPQPCDDFDSMPDRY